MKPDIKGYKGYEGYNSKQWFNIIYNSKIRITYTRESVNVWLLYYDNGDRFNSNSGLLQLHSEELIKYISYWAQEIEA